MLSFQLLLPIFIPGLWAFPLEDRNIPTLPANDAFYQVPSDIGKYEPGDILNSRKPPSSIAAFGVDPVNLQDTWQILYRTTDNLGNATATVLTILVPHNADMTKLLSYQVAEDAASINCAPSYALQLASATGGILGTIVTQAELLLIVAALEQGWVVILPDHEGPKGAYLANKLAGYATLDGIRAAINSGNFSGIQKDPTVALWGYSGGSIASASAAELQSTYAPEIQIAGAALGGTVPNISTVIKTINKTPFAGIIPAGMIGLSNQYSELQALVGTDVLQQYRSAFEKVGNQCFTQDILDFLLRDILAMLKDSSILTKDPVMKILNDNALGSQIPKIPLYIYKSILDEVSPIKDTDNLVQKYCDGGTPVQYVRDLVSEHGSLAAVGAPRAISWLIKVMNGELNQNKCSTQSVVSSLLDASSLEVIPQFLINALADLLDKPVGPTFFG